MNLRVCKIILGTWCGTLRREDHDGVTDGGGEIQESVDSLRDIVCLGGGDGWDGRLLWIHEHGPRPQHSRRTLQHCKKPWKTSVINQKEKAQPRWFFLSRPVLDISRPATYRDIFCETQATLRGSINNRKSIEISTDNLIIFRRQMHRRLSTFLLAGRDYLQILTKDNTTNGCRHLSLVLLFNNKNINQASIFHYFSINVLKYFSNYFLYIVISSL